MAQLGISRIIREGRDLGYWLWELVCDDMDRRDRAAAVLRRIHFDCPNDLAELERFDAEAHQEEFVAAVRRTLEAPDFDARAYLEELIDFMQAAQAHRMSLWEQDDERQDRILDRLVARLAANPNPEALVAIAPRIRRVICSGCDPKNVRAMTQDRLCQQQVTAGLVFTALREQLLLVPQRLLAMLRDNDDRWQAIDALERIGPAANRFAAELFLQLDACTEVCFFQAAGALASIIREDTPSVREVARRLGAETLGVATGAADTLGCLGSVAAQRDPDCIEALLVMTEHPHLSRRLAAVAALGKVTSGTDVAVDRLLALSDDAENWVRGTALTALGYVARQPNRVVPRLIEAFDDYREEDPDYTYLSDHVRVIEALQAFGQAAAPAVPALIARVRNSDGELDRGVVETLGKLGPAAGAALPVLEKMAEELGYEPDDLRDKNDPLAAAIAKIDDK